ncbi:helix-turn-helix transcriptional regulator [Streptomyces albus subsp. chlorinus]|uniref:winged helix-turn-helix transcriptional regulator n=1 Tax=Streptomyces albus TaxID=1888 RepID=UPI00156F1AFF|nr:helix-turn-helix domain-containing protein [Streptomyces albus]NSC19949.1 helix-turn-helix transcriptional regulator [Streptomyces albus subsp. chlorinus]
MRENIEQLPEDCALEAATSVFGGKWKLSVVKYLLDGPMRFGELRRALPGVTQRMLTRQLRELEADGIVLRTVYAQVPPKVEYSLTRTGRTLEDIVWQLDAWGRWYRDLRRSAPGPASTSESAPAAAPLSDRASAASAPAPAPADGGTRERGRPSRCRRS